MKIKISPDQNTVTVNKTDYEFIETTGNEFSCKICSFTGQGICREVPCDYRTNIGIPRIDNTAGYFIMKGVRP